MSSRHQSNHIRYKAAGANAVDDTGLRDSVEYINVAKDDVLAWPQTVHRTYPSPVNTHMETTIRPFTVKAIDVNTTLLAVFNDKLGLPQGTLAGLHGMYELSCSESRCIKKAPAPEQPQDQQALGAHTDFGSLVRPIVQRSMLCEAYEFEASPSSTII